MPFDLKKTQQNSFESQSGMVLVMALMILAIMMISALALSKIILGEVRMSLNVADSMRSFYAAESGMEKSLFYVKYAKEQGDASHFTDLEGTTDAFGSGNEYSFDVLTATTTQHGFTAYNIATSSSAYVDIIDPVGQVGSIDWGPNIASINYTYSLDWYIDQCFPSHASDKIEVTLNSFGPGFVNQRVDKKIVICNCTYNNDKCQTSITSGNLSDQKYYRFAFRPLDSMVKKLVFDLKEDGSSIGILSQTSIAVDGTYNNSKYRLRAYLPFVATVSDVFRYVIFSEEDLNKDL